ncbi:ion channel [Tropicimonas aquimaris]|uniref:Ion channel n=1 Tax=Tropicimonas aquimaris TaxID=914152 RepID=A0ABW3IL39_9RHOB
MERLKARVSELYTGQTPTARRLRYWLILFDLATVVYFIVTVPLPATPLLGVVNIALAVFIAIDFFCRLWISDNRWRHLGQIYVLADLIVLLSLVLDPLLHLDLTFLRILRGVRLGRSEYLLQDLRRDWRFFREHEDALVAALNLVVFVFVTTSAVYIFFADSEIGASGYVDSLYYTVTTLTTTGYGDITPNTPVEKIAAVAIMVVGVSLFLRLAGAVFTQSRVHHPCPRCGLTRHDPDAIHCKHCGEMLRIETEGAG